MSSAPTERFSGRVEAYVKYRPSYPDALLDLLDGELGLAPGRIVADIGSGTGILSKLFLDRGLIVWGVEPNPEMADAADVYLAGYDQFRRVDGTAEATGLPEGSVDWVAAGQAFHWFDAGAARAEATRILKPGGAAVVVWNIRRSDSTDFLREYEAFLRQWGTDYEQVTDDFDHSAALNTLFGRAPAHRALDNRQVFDRDGLRGRLLSCSYIPAPDHPRFAQMLEALDALFDRHAEDGRVSFEYDTQVFYGRIT